MAKRIEFIDLAIIMLFEMPLASGAFRRKQIIFTYDTKQAYTMA